MRKTLSMAFIGAVALVFTLTACSKDAEAVEAKIYGTINYKISNDEDTNGNSSMKAENNSSIIGIDASEAISENITGFAKLELGVDTDDTNNNPLDSRLAYAGINMNELGLLSAGRQASPFTTNVSGHTDVFEVYGSNADQTLFARDTNTVAYSNKIGAITFDGLVKIDGSTGKDGIDVQEGTLSFTDGMVKASAGVSNDRVNDINYYGAGVTLDATSKGMPITLGYTYTRKDAATDVNGNEIVASYITGKAKLTGGYGKVEDSTAYYTAGLSYGMTESLSTYVEYQHQDNTGSTLDTDSYSTGLKFSF